MLYLYFHSIYLFHVIPNSCLTSRPFTGPQQYEYLKQTDMCKQMITIKKEVFFLFSFFSASNKGIR